MPIRHMANSGSILQLPDSYFDMVRPGILFYGVYPSPEAQRTVAVKPALAWKSHVVYFKVTQPGHPAQLWLYLAIRSQCAYCHGPGRVWGWILSQYVQ